jgi:hypothetical protein
MFLLSTNPRQGYYNHYSYSSLTAATSATAAANKKTLGFWE